ncbi:YdeI/OmpD-associated family protein [Nakamurella lactea]|uniref:YdeI/OmpD-associated family protein n=1 Tax=Nakamurella lactea TaxID=459515 RepID=UPI000402C8A4|nr:YdeI/OmpD-associated family protein [Nakamurella lactea]
MQFRAELEATGANTTGIRVPADLVEELGGGRRPKVVVTLGEYSYRNSIALMGGEFWLGVSAEHRAGSGLTAGDAVEVTIELDTAPRTVEVPDDLADALTATAGAREAFDAMAYTHRKEWVRSIEEAKKPETRAKRIAAAVAACVA